MRKMVGVYGVEPYREHPSDAKGFIRPSCVPTPTPIKMDLLTGFEPAFTTPLRLKR